MISICAVAAVPSTKSGAILSLTCGKQLGTNMYENNCDAYRRAQRASMGPDKVAGTGRYSVVLNATEFMTADEPADSRHRQSAFTQGFWVGLRALLHAKYQPRYAKGYTPAAVLRPVISVVSPHVAEPKGTPAVRAAKFV